MNNSSKYILELFVKAEYLPPPTELMLEMLPKGQCYNFIQAVLRIQYKHMQLIRNQKAIALWLKSGGQKVGISNP